MFDLSGVSAEELADVGILQSVLGIIDTENYEYSELFNEINVNTEESVHHWSCIIM